MICEYLCACLQSVKKKLLRVQHRQRRFKEASDLVLFQGYVQSSDNVFDVFLATNGDIIRDGGTIPEK